MPDQVKRRPRRDGAPNDLLAGEITPKPSRSSASVAAIPASRPGHTWMRVSPRKVRSPLDAVSKEAAFLWCMVQIFLAAAGGDGTIARSRLPLATARRLSQRTCDRLVAELASEGLMTVLDGDRLAVTPWEQPSPSHPVPGAGPDHPASVEDTLAALVAGRAALEISPASVLAVSVALQSLLDAGNDTPTRAEIAQRTALSASTVGRALIALRDLNLVAWRGHVINNRRVANSYQITSPAASRNV
jgi:hypothetical protein